MIGDIYDITVLIDQSARNICQLLMGPPPILAFQARQQFRKLSERAADKSKQLKRASSRKLDVRRYELYYRPASSL